jgi:SAM-dependent methyltransferase
MAISIIEYQLIRSLREQNYLPLGGDLMEIGEANWYGDVGLDVLRADIARFAALERRQELLAGLERIAAAPDGLRGWDMARIFWHAFLQPGSISAIDLHGSRHAQKLDLNQPIRLGHQFHVVHNNGTLEHIFDIAQGFRNMHDLARPGGLMIHHAPFVGWVDHGFYGLHPTLFWDIAEANGYRMVALVYAEIDPPRLEMLPSREAVLALAPSMGRNGNLAAVMQRPLEAMPFRVPMQGYYAGKVSEAAAEAWNALR